jgi:cardiolipin synthase A/B
MYQPRPVRNAQRFQVIPSSSGRRDRPLHLITKSKWRIGVAIALVVVVSILFLAQDKSTLNIQSPVAATDGAFVSYLALHLNAPITRGNVYEVLENGDEIFPPMLEAIRHARTRIEFESYIFSGDMGEAFTKELIDASRRGVTVRMVLDALGVSLPPRSLRQRIENAGGHLVWFNGLRTWTLKSANYRTHRKLLIVDGAVAFTGGAGVADHWMGNADAPDHWRDTQFRITGPSVAMLEAAFFENWIEGGGDPDPIFDPPDLPRGSPAPAVTVWSNASEGVNDVKLMYLYAIASARRSIDLESPYVILDSSTRLVLTDALKRGVQVRILTDGHITDAKPVKYTSRYEYDRLMTDGAHIYEYQPTMMHAKVMVIDGLVSVIGTANFDNRSLELNDEVGIAVVDPELAGTLTASFERDLARSKTWTLDEWRGRPIYSKALEMFWAPFGEMF